MKIISIVLNVIIAIYFFVVANLFFWASIIAIFAGVSQTQTQYNGSLAVTHPLQSWLIPINILLSPFLVYGTVMFFRKTKNKYNYGLILLAVILLVYVFYGSFSERKLAIGRIELQNALFFLVPMAVVYLAKWLDTKVPSQIPKPATNL